MVARRPSGPDVYERLREDIVAKRLEVGASLVETDLADRYGTSRTPVREALRRLEQDGLLERGRRGLQVRTPSPEEILEIYEVRIDLEALAAALAAERHTPLDMVRLEAAAATMEGTPTDDAVMMASANHSFHEHVWEAAHNATLLDVNGRLMTHLTRYPSTTLVWPGRWEAVLAEHRELIELITNRDALGARALMERHMHDARDVRLHMYASHDGERAAFS
ncbi:MAG: GntR family transcriptional regulator [Acidimicrobiaceae bacterium]|nr:GntR family transcriptional regulator [Acidimicrobiaceae bacterium]